MLYLQMLIRYTLQGILSDLFPGVVLPEHDYGVLQSAIETATSNRGLQIVHQQVHTHKFKHVTIIAYIICL